MAATTDTIALFRYSLTKLRIDDQGVAASDYNAVVVCANLCKAVREATAATALDDVHGLLLHRLVVATEDLLTTYVVGGPENKRIVATWLSARSELLANSYRTVYPDNR